MGEIKFDAARMSELANRLDEIASQLKYSAESCNSSIDTIKMNINGESVVTTLTGYTQATKIILDSLYPTLNEVIGSLRVKIKNYTQTEQEAANQLTDVQSILQGIDSI